VPPEPIALSAQWRAGPLRSVAGLMVFRPKQANSDEK
jgi:hypothetical protein